MNNTTDFFQKLFDVLDKVYKYLSDVKGTNQNLRDIQSGYMKVNGILVPFKEYRLSYDHYDMIVLSAYTKLAKAVFKEREATFTPLSFRPLQELGITKADILFSNVIEQKDKSVASLVAVLADWCTMGERKHKNDFSNLYKEELDKLDEKNKVLFEKINNEILKGRPVDSALVKAARKASGYIFNNLHKKVPTLDFIKNSNLDGLYSWWSHLLHGNPFLLENLFNEQISWRNKNRALAMLWITGLNVLLRIKGTIKDPAILKQIEELESEKDAIWVKLMDEWKAESLGKPE